jgi:hypothetical protein
MELETIRSEKIQLEKELADLLNAKLSDFAAKTGYSPYGVAVKMLDVSTIGTVETLKKEYRVGSVQMKVDFGL